MVVLLITQHKCKFTFISFCHAFLYPVLLYVLNICLKLLEVQKQKCVKDEIF